MWSTQFDIVLYVLKVIFSKGNLMRVSGHMLFSLCRLKKKSFTFIVKYFF